MILIDTSVWIDFFRGKDASLKKDLSTQLDEDQVALAIPIRLEILSGTSKQEKNNLQRVLSALPLFYPTTNHWSQMEEWIDSAIAKGDRFSVFDLLIAAIAKENNCTLWSLDQDFRQMEKLGWIILFTPSK